MDTMIYHEFLMPLEVAKQIALAAKEKRLSLNFSQQSLSERSGVSLGVLKNFERTGKISLFSLLKLALTLGCLGDFVLLFKQLPNPPLRTLDDLLNQKKRKRGRK